MEKYRFVLVLVAYLLGSISPSYFIGRLKGYDIREVGSGNAGASNVTIAFGWKWGVFTALFDIFKAFFAVKLAAWNFADDQLLAMLCGAAAILGHLFPFYMHFRGGKGYASITGMGLALNWKIGLIMILVGALITLCTGYIALATIVTSITYPIYYYLTKAPLAGTLALGAVALIMIYKHRGNLSRIIKGSEVKLFDANKHRVG